MSELKEELKKDAVNGVELTELELATQAMELANSITIEDVEQQEAENAKALAGFVKIPFFSMKEEKTYELRLLPLKPEKDAPPVKDIVYPIHQAVLKIETASNPRYVTVCRPDYAGIDGDLLRYYRKRVKEISTENKDESLDKAMTNYKTNIKYDKKYIGYAIDHNERTNKDKTPRIVSFAFSHTQMKGIKDIQNSTWKELEEDGLKVAAPFTSLKDAYRLKISKSSDESGTKYTPMTSARQNDSLSNEEVVAWFGLPTIPEQFYIYTRYSHEALLVALSQWDAKYGLSITQEPEFIEINEKVLAQFPATDTSSFSLAGKKEEGGADETSAILLEDLVNELDRIEEEGIDPKASEEAGILRSKIQQFIDDEELEITITRSKTNSMLIDAIVDEIQDRAENVRDAAESKKGRKR